jgi:hypothetical protein
MQQTYVLNKIINFWSFIPLQKIGCYKPTPLKMNLILEIRMDQKRNLETLPSTLFLFPM